MPLRARGAAGLFMVVACAAPEPPSGAPTLVSLAPPVGSAEQAAGASALPLVVAPPQLAWDAAVDQNADPKGTVVVVGVDANFCLDVYNGQPRQGQALEIYPCDNVPAGQAFVWTGGQLRVDGSWCVSLDSQAGLVLLDSCAAPGANAAQLWDFVGGQLVNSPTQTCIGLPATLAPAPRTTLVAAPCDANSALQSFSLAQVNMPAFAPTPVFTGVRLGLASSPANCLDLVGGNAADHTPCRSFSCNIYQAQKWLFTGAHVIQQGRCLTAAGGTLAAGSAVEIDGCGGAGQAWAYVGGQLQAAGSALCAGIASGGDPTNSPLELVPCQVNGQSNPMAVWNIGTPPS